MSDQRSSFYEESPTDPTTPKPPAKSSSRGGSTSARDKGGSSSGKKGRKSRGPVNDLQLHKEIVRLRPDGSRQDFRDFQNEQPELAKKKLDWVVRAQNKNKNVYDAFVGPRKAVRHCLLKYIYGNKSEWRPGKEERFSCKSCQGCGFPCVIFDREEDQLVILLGVDAETLEQEAKDKENEQYEEDDE